MLLCLSAWRCQWDPILFCFQIYACWTSCMSSRHLSRPRSSDWGSSRAWFEQVKRETLRYLPVRWGHGWNYCLCHGFDGEKLIELSASSYKICLIIKFQGNHLWYQIPYNKIRALPSLPHRVNFLLLNFTVPAWAQTVKSRFPSLNSARIWFRSLRDVFFLKPHCLTWKLNCCLLSYN